jgi:hypothetical protein
MTTTTDANGYYAFEHLRYNASYVLKAENVNNTSSAPNIKHFTTNVSANVGANTSTGNAYIIYGAERSVKISGAITRQNFVVEPADRETMMAQNMPKTAPEVEVGQLKVNPK